MIQPLTHDEFSATARTQLVISKIKHKRDRSGIEGQDNIRHIEKVGSFWHCLKCYFVPEKLVMINTLLCCPRCKSPRVKLCCDRSMKSYFVNDTCFQVYPGYGDK
jgi:Zn finger protein HypA/HybF involved in hydrogenase expression